MRRIIANLLIPLGGIVEELGNWRFPTSTARWAPPSTPPSAAPMAFIRQNAPLTGRSTSEAPSCCGVPLGCRHEGGLRTWPSRCTRRSIRTDQRGCGRSTPCASDPTTDMRHNTTGHLLADMERLREHLGIQRWLLCGGSWGSTLILAYAERHPKRVSEIVIPSVTTCRRSEIDWLYRGAGRFLPEQWERFRAGVPAADRDGDLLGAYARLLEDPDPAVRARAASIWCAWEDAILSQEPSGTSSAFRSRARQTGWRWFASVRTISPTEHGWKTVRCCGMPGAWPTSRVC
jgi:pimeloyl-ACP methyl ester carboxylesterase